MRISEGVQQSDSLLLPAETPRKIEGCPASYSRGAGAARREVRGQEITPAKNRGIPRLRDPTRQIAARGTKSGRSARDDKRRKGRARQGVVLNCSESICFCHGCGPASTAIRHLSLFVQSLVDRFVTLTCFTNQPPETTGAPTRRARAQEITVTEAILMKQLDLSPRSSSPSGGSHCSCLRTEQATGERAGQTATGATASAGKPLSSSISSRKRSRRNPHSNNISRRNPLSNSISRRPINLRHDRNKPTAALIMAASRPTAPRMAESTTAACHNTQGRYAAVSRSLAPVHGTTTTAPGSNAAAITATSP